MQQTSSSPTRLPAKANELIATYGPFILSFVAILVVAIAWFLKDLDTNTAITTIVAILAGNGLVGATRWQAAPGLLADLQQIIDQLAGHIQALHQAQLQTIQSQPAPVSVDQAATAKIAAIPVAPTQSASAPAPGQQRAMGG